MPTATPHLNGHADAAAVCDALDLFRQPGEVVELRVIGRKKWDNAAGYFDNSAVAAAAVEKWSKKRPEANFYFTLNTCNAALLARSANRISEKLDPLTSDRDITRRCWLPIDIDPVRPAGVSSTDEELQAATDIAAAIREFLADMHFHEPVEARSGNGFHLLYPIDLPNDEESRMLVESVLKVLDARFSSAVVSVDTKVGNAARIFRLYGTYSRKGDDLPNRPHRRSEITCIPDGMPGRIDPTPRERLQAVADMMPKPEQNPKTNAHIGTNHVLQVDRWLTERGIRFTVKGESDRTVYAIDCPFNSEHRGEANITQFESGALSAGCFHNSCAGLGWKDFKSTIGPPDRERHYEPPYPPKPIRERQRVTEPSDEPEAAPLPAAVSIGTLADKYPHQRPHVIRGILRQGETGGINAKAKIGKSWTAYGIALCVATGRAWLDRFECVPGRVLLVDFELHPETLAKRIPRVAEAMGIQPDEYRDRIDVIAMRGRLRDIYQLEPLFAGIERGRYLLIVLDALYRTLPPGVSENDNAEMAKVFNAIDRYADMTGAAFLAIHHQTKGDQSGKDVVDVGSGASAFARAVDAHLVLRRHEEVNHVVLDGAVRSWEPIEPLVLRWEYPLWHPTEDVDPAGLKGLKTRGEETQAAKDAEADAAVLQAADGWTTHRQLRKQTGMGYARLDRCIARLRSRGHLEHQEQDGNGGKAECFQRSWRAPVIYTEGNIDGKD